MILFSIKWFRKDDNFKQEIITNKISNFTLLNTPKNCGSLKIKLIKNLSLYNEVINDKYKGIIYERLL